MERVKLTDTVLNAVLTLDCKFFYYEFDDITEVKQTMKESGTECITEIYCLLFQDPVAYQEDIKLFDAALSSVGYEDIPLKNRKLVYELAMFDYNFDYYDFRNAYDYVYQAMKEISDDIPGAIKCITDRVIESYIDTPDELTEFNELLVKYGYTPIDTPEYDI